MNLRPRNFPPNFWIQLHTHTINSLPTLSPKRTRNPSKKKVNSCVTFLSPHVQKFIYNGAIDKRKGEIRSHKFPLSPEQFTTMVNLGLTNKYQDVILLEHELKLHYNFIHKGYLRGIQNIQFRLQKQKPVITGQSCIFLLRVRFHQKAPILS
ncbi:unnamed protein product [Rotaria sordida]|uniref:Uncharacterized protein n=1 Tax=Rotaria sordida TaxID=392033 RepID=A0A815TVC3_9BILA|nr:unnamed protein product [Rotaria sordida]CAF4152928.1 unnamed protein product [Rotaria sordida]